MTIADLVRHRRATPRPTQDGTGPRARLSSFITGAAIGTGCLAGLAFQAGDDALCLLLVAITMAIPGAAAAVHP